MDLDLLYTDLWMTLRVHVKLSDITPQKTCLLH